MRTDFAISAWAACAPGVVTPSDWQDWALRPRLPAGVVAVELNDMPAMHRRRLGPLGRMAARVAYDCQRTATGMPVVFASRYGDAARSLGVLHDHVLGQAVSPTDFALAVHNAIGAMYSIARKDDANYTAIASGQASAAAGVVEAVGLLHDGAKEVLLVCYDAPLPGDYAEFADEPAALYAWAWRLCLPRTGEPYLSLELTHQAQPAGTGAVPLPFGLDVLRFFLSDAPALHCVGDGMSWTWRRHG
jgi:hypothetical protein